ncbi:MAG: insulinase family protein [Candidatus Hydrogenedentes bacterium]|nr:insulinase family protein [Candidatus Hydrogenedentota bacterium]
MKTLYRSTLPLFLAGLIAAVNAFAAKPFEFEDIKLDNGLRVVTLEDFSTPIVAVQVWYHVGSKNEQATRQGFAHMFEHMMFGGTDLVNAEEYSNLIRKVGGDCNAFTSFDFTAYVNTVPSNQLELVLWLESQRMMFLKVDEKGFDTERKVVEEERRMGLNQPYGSVMEQVLPVLFKEHPYRWSPIGNIPDLRAAKAPELAEFWNYFYVPQNATLVIAGAVKHADAQALAKKYFSWMPSGDTTGRLTFTEPEQKETREITVEEPFGPVPLIGYVFKTVPETHADSIPLELMMIALGQGDSSRLNVDLVKKRNLCVQALADTYMLQDAGVCGAGAALNPMANPEVAFKALDEHLTALKEKGLEEKELTKAKNQLRRTLVADSLTVENKANNIGDATTIHGTPEWLNERMARIDAATLDDIKRVANAYLVPERKTVLHVKPNPEKKLSADAERGTESDKAGNEFKYTNPKEGVKRPEGFSTTPPMHELLQELPQTPTSERTLKNGLKVVVVPNHELPFMTVMLGSKYGAWAEDAAAPGVASMTLNMLTKGTKKHTAEELAEIIEFNALTLEGDATMDAAQVTATGLSDKLPLAVELLAEVVLSPTFPQEELDILAQQRTMTLSVRDQSPDYVAARELRRHLYGAHPYSRTPEGESEDVAKLKPELLAAYWAKYARPDTSVVYVAGDVDEEKAVALVEQYLGEWKVEGSAPEISLPAIPTPEKTHILLVDRPGAVQSQIKVGETNITRSDPRYHFARVFSQVYGGAFDSRLNTVIRIQRGLTYGASGGFIPHRFSGEFTSSTFTKTESTAETVQAVLDVLAGMRKEAPTDEEINTAKSYLVGNFPSGLETPQDVVNYAWLIEYSGLPKDYLNQAVQAYNKAQRQDLADVAEKIVNLDRLTIVVAGEASKIKEGLEKIAPVTVIEAAKGQETPGDTATAPEQPKPAQ